ncbi:uncharacterized protein BO96DRAFT_393477 [Aspergillus niger CBS 101883]|uniref:Contig An08c0060, genomic contig n=2 Tax=Aspergillus niger TaxID=5061 RepID=A2QQB0_ASPNC|nr:uncharacterized protein BO96DRAFT_393477 [Aspergillus niger CBS 101883]XP_059601159.1 uncharacterized protein An08g01870 [Aspergillus niger]PYH56231.1 hypothetical protein BO96DRAFT_393477 [Aspergillus niger CBS 101883]CAK39867.1 unnamed protein product [Aspergillus niger]
MLSLWLHYGTSTYEEGFTAVYIPFYWGGMIESGTISHVTPLNELMFIVEDTSTSLRHHGPSPTDVIPSFRPSPPSHPIYPFTNNPISNSNPKCLSGLPSVGCKSPARYPSPQSLAPSHSAPYPPPQPPLDSDSSPTPSPPHPDSSPQHQQQTHPPTSPPSKTHTQHLPNPPPTKSSMNSKNYEFEIATESTDSATIYAASDRESARDALNELIAVYTVYTRDMSFVSHSPQGQVDVDTGLDPGSIGDEVREQVRKRVGTRVREIVGAVENLEERASAE